ncbi:MAG: DnaJ domain-containing protein [Acidobacteria bacterium]|nr:DnaJ domain-containing protein [Acidobacteriota bacterium]
MNSHLPQGASDPADAELMDFLRSVYLARRSGVLEVFQGEQIRRFYFVDGELFLMQGHPLAQRMEAFLGGSGGNPQASLAALLRRSHNPGAPPEDAAAKEAQELRWLLRRIAKFLHQLAHERFGFVEGRDGLPDKLVGPLPTGFLIMEAATVDRTDTELLLDLGGESERWVSYGDKFPAELPWLETDEAFLLSRCERPMAVGELLRQLGTDRSQTLLRLARLRALGLLRRAAKAAEPARATEAPRRVQPEVLSRFLDRVGRELETRSVDLDREDHRRFIAELFTSLGERDFYQLLEVGPDTAPEKLVEAYSRLARRVHPSHAARLELAGGDSVLELLFERATEAYLTLSDPSRRGRYNRETGVSFVINGASDEEVAERNREMAREHFTRARQLVAAQQYHAAHELLREACRRDPQADYFALLAQVQTKNPNWIRQAVDNYRRAVDLDPSGIEHRLALALTCEEAGYLGEAKAQFARVLEQRPDHPIAQAGIKRIEHQDPESAPDGGFFDRVRSRLAALFGSRG